MKTIPALALALLLGLTACGSSESSAAGSTTPDASTPSTATSEPNTSTPDSSVPETSTTAPPAGDSSGDIAASVSIIDFEFADGNVTVNVGDTIEWTNTGDIAHTVTSDNADFDSGSLSKGDTFTFKATEAGDFTYFCQFHSNMQGSITVIG